MFCVLEYCPEEIRFDREQYYINSLKPEYNLTLNVIANFGHEVSEETKNKMTANFWYPVMKNCVITFPKPQNCPLHKTLGEMEMKKFGEEFENFIGLKEFGEAE